MPGIFRKISFGLGEKAFRGVAALTVEKSQERRLLFVSQINFDCLDIGVQKVVLNIDSQKNMYYTKTKNKILQWCADGLKLVRQHTEKCILPKQTGGMSFNGITIFKERLA